MILKILQSHKKVYYFEILHFNIKYLKYSGKIYLHDASRSLNSRSRGEGSNRTSVIETGGSSDPRTINTSESPVTTNSISNG